MKDIPYTQYDTHNVIFFFLMIRRPPRSTLFPTRRSSDLACRAVQIGEGRGKHAPLPEGDGEERRIDLGKDRKSTRLNSSHSQISYAVFCLKKKKTDTERIYCIRTTDQSQSQ